jgi:diguanylate cyclase (GGDEF)-like protein
MVSPVKEALRRGFYEETGLPFTQDSTFPTARSFVALGLEHRGAAVGVLYAATSTLTPPPASVLHRAQPLFSMAFSRALYRLEMEDAAIRDALSSVYTQDHFLALARRELSRSNRYSHPVSCVAFDVDHLRGLNDSHGVQGGDRLVAEVARVVGGTVRSSDALARITGGEFVVLLPEAGETAAVAAAERIRSAVEGHPFLLESNRVERLTVSVGVATHPPHGLTALSLADAARAAMLEAKAAGRNRVEVTLGEPRA